MADTLTISAAEGTVTAKAVIRSALTFYTNILSPGEPLDEDVSSVALDALNDLVDEINGRKAVLFKEILSAGTVTGASGTLGSTWADLVPGDDILGATITYTTNTEMPLEPISMAQYANIPIKSLTSLPTNYAYDGAATVYVYPASPGHTITLRTRSVMSDFADLDTGYILPKGYKSALSAMLAEKVMPAMTGGVSASVVAAAKNARQRLVAQTIKPAILGAKTVRGNIFTGWR